MTFEIYSKCFSLSWLVNSSNESKLIPHCSHLYCFFSSDDINYHIHQCIIQLAQTTYSQFFVVSVSVSGIIEIWTSSVVKIMSQLNHIICPACGNGILTVVDLNPPFSYRPVVDINRTHCLDSLRNCSSPFTSECEIQWE